MSFEAQHAAYLALCNAAVDAAAANHFKPGSRVSEAAAYSLKNGGKRVRGVLALAVCDMMRGNMDAAGVFAASVEMIHSFSLIHDDLPCMDDDDLRRGKPACHIVYGEDIALLAGDLLALEGLHCAAGAQLKAGQTLRAVTTLAAAAGARGMIYGQELDMQAENAPDTGRERLEEIQRHKTGALIVAAAQMGAIAASANADRMAAVTEYAFNIGLVFQIIDDILDENSTPEVLGKPVGSDAKNSKSTFARLLGIEGAREKAEQLTARAVAALQGAFGEEAAFLMAFARRLLERTN